MAYSNAHAKVLHSLPVVMVLTRMLIRGGSQPSLKSVGNGAIVFAASCVCAVLAPALLGVVRVLLLGKSKAIACSSFAGRYCAQNSMTAAPHSYTQAVQWFGIPSIQ